jgi:hypothetical protein
MGWTPGNGPRGGKGLALRQTRGKNLPVKVVRFFAICGNGAREVIARARFGIWQKACFQEFGRRFLHV